MLKVNKSIKGGKLKVDEKWKLKGFYTRFFRLDKDGKMKEAKEFDKVDPTEVIVSV